MECYVGQSLGGICGGRLIDCSIWTVELRQKLTKRVEAAALRPLLTIPNCCEGHKAMFLDDYRNFQKTDVGCCNPFLIHSEKEFRNVEDVSKALSENVTDTFPFVIEGRQICCACKSKLMETNDPLVGQMLVDEAYNYDEVQALFEKAMTAHGQILEEKLKPLQAEGIHKILKGKDLLCILATNYGKTAIIIFPSFIMSKMTRSLQVCLIVSPLKTLMEDLRKRLEEWNLRNIILTKQNMTDSECIISILGEGNLVYLITSPELMETEEARKFLLKVKISQIQIDEVHTAVTWGKEFRKSFTLLGNLRMFTDCPVGVFTATFIKDMMKEVLKNTGLMSSTLEIVASTPDRPEIFIDMRRKKRFEIDFQFLKDEANDKKTSLPRTLVFVDSVVKTHDMNLDFRAMVLDKGRVYKDGKLWDYLSDHFSASTEPMARERILNSFSDPVGCTRVLFSTVSYGMGMDNKTIDRVIIYDYDKDPLSLWQKIGRGCRSGMPGKAIIFSRTENYGSWILKGECIRDAILSKLMGYSTTKKTQVIPCACKTLNCTCSLCSCCSNCKKRCKCIDDAEEDWDTQYMAIDENE